ncbi:MAG: hypothetical protein DHS80DRAFT_15903, partial [Piptocephalis tieghemiana]
GTPPSKRYGHTASLWRNQIVIFGGSNDFQEFCNDIVVFDLTTRSWSRPKVTGHNVAARYLHSATVWKDKLYVYGGFARGHDCTYVLAELWILDLLTFTWSEPHAVPPRYNHSATLAGDTMYIYGGKDGSGKTVGDLLALDPTGSTPSWKSITDMTGPMPLLKSQHFAEYLDPEGLLIIFGKYVSTDGPPEKTAYGLWALDVARRSWKLLPMEEDFDEGMWSYFTVDTLLPRRFVLLGNVSPRRGQAYDHFQDMRVVDPEALGIWQIPKPRFTQDISALLAQTMMDSTLPYDFTLVTSGDVRLRAHKAILWARWPHFRHLLGSGMAETTEGLLRLPEPPSVIFSLLTYLYTDQLPKERSPYPSPKGTMVLGSMYFLRRLCKLCSRRLAERWIQPETCGAILEAAIDAREDGLRAITLSYIYRYYGRVLRAGGLEDLRHETWQAFRASVPIDASLLSPGAMRSKAPVASVEGTRREGERRDTREREEEERGGEGEDREA